MHENFWKQPKVSISKLLRNLEKYSDLLVCYRTADCFLFTLIWKNSLQSAPTQSHPDGLNITKSFHTCSIFLRVVFLSFLEGSIPDAQYRVGKGYGVECPVRIRAVRSAPAQHFARGSLCCSAISTGGWWKKLQCKTRFRSSKAYAKWDIFFQKIVKNTKKIIIYFFLLEKYPSVPKLSYMFWKKFSILNISALKKLISNF